MENTKAAESTGIKLEVGKAYRTRNGKKAIVDGTQNTGSYKFDGNVEGSIETWTADGRVFVGMHNDYDIVALWEEPAPAVDAEGWIEWKGGLSTLHPKTEVIVRFRDGAESGQNTSAFWSGDNSIDCDNWQHSGSKADIVAYRVVRDPCKVDLSMAQIGDTAVLRSGGKAVITLIDRCRGEGPEDWNIRFGGPCEYLYCEGGAFMPSGYEPMDIIAIEPKPFDWKDVEPGMAFRRHSEDNSRRLIYYVGPYLADDRVKDLRVFWDAWEGSYGPFGEHLVRAPEHDIKAGA